MRRRISILDPGLFSTGSHNFNYSLALCKELRARSCDVELYAFRDADPRVIAATGAIPHFTHLLWNRIDTNTPFDEELNWRVLNDAFEADLSALGGAIAGADRVLVLPNILQHQIAGFARWYRALPDDQKPYVLLNLMFYPRWTAWADQAVRGAEFYLRAIEDIRPWLGARINLCAENRDIANYYAKLVRAPVDVTPIPTEPPARLQRPDGAPVRIGFLGYAKNEKGFFLLPNALRHAFNRRRDFRALVQIHHHGAEPETVAADRALSQMDGVDIVRGNVGTAHYQALFASCDVVLLPYDPFHYSTRGSGVLSEAIACAKPVVGTENTWAAQAIRHGECAGIACEFDSHALGTAVLEALDTLPALTPRSKEISQRWLSAQSTEAYCDTIEAIDGVARPSTPRVAKLGPDLSSAFPTWPHMRMGALPKSQDPHAHENDGFNWCDDGRVELVARRGQLGLTTPCHGPPTRLDLALSASSEKARGKVHFTLNGVELGAAIFGPGRRTISLPLPRAHISAALPCMLQVNVSDGAPQLVIHGARFVLARARSR